ncbi:hypothetical protein FACS189459_5030 [Bacilli bacterium]|nr:hypothetical protein FACS189459_5030 [Bacilli bacterium]
MSSLKDNIFKLGLKLDGIKYAGSIKKIDKRVINKPRKFTPPLSMKFFCKIKRSVVNGFTVYEITPKVKKLNENAIMYIHGGGYILEISVFH